MLPWKYYLENTLKQLPWKYYLENVTLIILPWKCYLKQLQLLQYYETVTVIMNSYSYYESVTLKQWLWSSCFLEKSQLKKPTIHWKTTFWMLSDNNKHLISFSIKRHSRRWGRCYCGVQNYFDRKHLKVKMTMGSMHWWCIVLISFNKQFWGVTITGEAFPRPKFHSTQECLIIIQSF